MIRLFGVLSLIALSSGCAKPDDAGDQAAVATVSLAQVLSSARAALETRDRAWFEATVPESCPCIFTFHGGEGQGLRPVRKTVLKREALFDRVLSAQRPERLEAKAIGKRLQDGIVLSWFTGSRRFQLDMSFAGYTPGPAQANGVKLYIQSMATN
jgi:hypothetical protein